MFETMRNTTYRFPIDLQFFNGGGDGGTGDPQTFTEEQVKEREKAAATAAAAKAIKDRFGDLADMDLKDIRAAIALKKKADEDAAAAAAKAKGKDKDGEDKGISPEDVDKLLDERLKEREKEQEKHMFQRELRADVKVLAAELGFADFEDALALADFSQVKRNEKGDLDGVKEALEELLKKKPHLGKQKPGSGAFGANVGGAGGSGGDKKDRLERMKKLAQGEGTAAPAANDPWKR